MIINQISSYLLSKEKKPRILAFENDQSHLKLYDCENFFLFELEFDICFTKFSSHYHISYIVLSHSILNLTMKLL